MSKAKSGKEVRITVDHNLDERVIKKVKVDADIQGKNDAGKIDFNALKSGGFIKQRQKDKFTVRLNCPGGRMPIEKLKVVAQVAEKYGDEFVHFSVRQSLEIPTVDYHDFNEMIGVLKEVDQNVASCGPRVRVPTACGGCAYNPNGITDTQRMAQEVTDKFFGMETNHKFKVSFSGCPFDCIHTIQADLGFQGGILPEWVEDKCTGCTICSSACREGAIESHPDTGQPIFDASHCIFCDDCVRACPTFAWEAGKTGHIVRVGGHGGRHPVIGSVVARFISDAEVHAVIKATIKWYREKGKGKGRIRIGNILQEDGMMESFMEMLKDTIGEESLEKNPVIPTPLITNPKGEGVNEWAMK